MKTLFFVFALASCSRLSELDEFEVEARNRGCRYFPTSINFTKLLSDISAGYCIPGVGVFLNANLWPDYERYQRLELVFHEIGHCSLGYGHGDENGIMSPTMHSEKEIETSWAIWVDDYFEGCKLSF